MSYDQSEEVIAAARRCFAARPGTPLESFLAGPLLTYSQLFENLPGFLQPLIWNAHVRSLRVETIEGAAAFCDCDVVTVSDYASPAGLRLRAIGRITAPLVLELGRDGWRVVDYAFNGRRVLRSIRLYDASASTQVGELTLRPVALELATRGTVLLLSVANHSAWEVAMEHATLPGEGRLGPWLRSREHAVFAGERRIPPGQTWTLVALWDTTQPILARTVAIGLSLRHIGPERLLRTELNLPFTALPEPTVAAYEGLERR